MDLFTPKGGTALGGALEALAQTEKGAELLGAVHKKLNGGKNGAEKEPGFQ